MKRTLQVLLMLLTAVILALPARALAQEESVLIRVGTASGASGTEIDVPVTLENCAGVDSVQFDLNYDAAALQVLSMTPGDLFPAQYTVANLNIPGRIRIACASALGIDGAGTLLTLRFRALTDAGSAITLTSGIVTHIDADYNQSEAYVALENGGITIGSAPLPQAAVTPWIPVTPVPTPSPTPSPSPTPTATPEPAEISIAPQTTAAPAATGSIPTITYLIAGGLVLVIIVIVALIAGRRKRNRK